MSNELTRAWRFLRGALVADTELFAIVGQRVHRGSVPENGVMPAVIYALIAPGETVTALGGNRVWSAPVFKVVGVMQTTNGLLLEPMADRIDAALHNASGMAGDDGYVYSCEYLRPFELIERTGDKTYQQLGGEYRVAVTAG